MKEKLNHASIEALVELLKARFIKSKHLQDQLKWPEVHAKLEKARTENEQGIRTLLAMEQSGGEPALVKYDKEKDKLVFYDCVPESPAGRRSLCYDWDALEARKEHKPAHSAEGMAEEMGAELLNEEQYRFLQSLGKFDTKTSSWLKTPASVRKLGGAIFGDFRYWQVFVYHNGAQSYYAARGFRVSVEI